ncbi:MAG: microsomal signal peptidase 12 kDa subunit-domain-containing protein [Monoraphidium minutum]|nr:MAG: microsomal signal peptidase 12 kDa subunit-domain-containing protein [Monoraphidium minutum]
MDFEGQKLAETLLYRLLVLFGAIGFLVGYAVGSFRLMVLINAGGLALTLLAVVPNWPWFNRNPLSWLPPLNPDDAVASSGSGGAGSSSSAAGKGKLVKR